MTRFLNNPKNIKDSFFLPANRTRDDEFPALLGPRHDRVLLAELFVVLLHALDVVAETARMKVVVARGLDEDVLVHNVVQTDGAGASGNVGLRQELLAHVDHVEDDRGAEIGVLGAAGAEGGEQGGDGAVQEPAGVADLRERKKDIQIRIKEEQKQVVQEHDSRENSESGLFLV